MNKCAVQLWRKWHCAAGHRGETVNCCGRTFILSSTSVVRLWHADGGELQDSAVGWWILQFGNHWFRWWALWAQRTVEYCGVLCLADSCWSAADATHWAHKDYFGQNRTKWRLDQESWIPFLSGNRPDCDISVSLFIQQRRNKRQQKCRKNEL